MRTPEVEQHVQAWIWSLQLHASVATLTAVISSVKKSFPVQLRGVSFILYHTSTYHRITNEFALLSPNPVRCLHVQIRQCTQFPLNYLLRSLIEI